MTETDETQWKDVDDGSKDLGFGFWAKGAGVFLLCGIVLFIILFFVTRAIYAWGVLAGFVLLVAIALFAAWWKDRKEVEAYEETDKVDKSLPDHQA